MNINITVIIALVAYIFGAITKAFITKIPSKFIPLQNTIIGIISALICWLIKIEPNFITALVACMMATMSAGGIADLTKITKSEDDVG